MTLRLTELASSDLHAIYDFIALDNMDAAIETIQGLFQAMEQLTRYPRLGRTSNFGTRKLIHSPFVIVYRVVGNVINVESVLHGNRRYE
jgi:toxin ParE1/3/4